MYRATDPQAALFTPVNILGESARQRLHKSWAQYFALEIMPILYGVEDEFAPIYGMTGRPNWSVARKLGLCILQELFNLDDQRALDCMSFDVRWQHALGLSPEDAYLARRSLIDFRNRLLEHDPSMKLLDEVFVRTSEAMLERFNVSLDHQRVDSTHITSNIRRRGRRALFGKVLEVFLRQLRRESPDSWEKVPEAIRCWYDTEAEDIDSWFGPGQNQGPDLAARA
jgi:transposase